MSTLRDKYGERMSRMQSNIVDLAAFEELFSFACPKFISPAAPSYDALPANYNPQEAYRLQLRLFTVRAAAATARLSSVAAHPTPRLAPPPAPSCPRRAHPLAPRGLPTGQ